MDVLDKIRKKLNSKTSLEVRLIQLLIKICWNSTTENILEGKLFISKEFALEDATEEEWRAFLHYVKTQKR